MPPPSFSSSAWVAFVLSGDQAGPASVFGPGLRQHPPIAAEISFLLEDGVAPSLLREGMRLAQISDVSPSEALLSHGLLDENTFFRALARVAGLPFLAAPQASAAALYPESIQAGLAPLDERHAPLHFAVAPTGPRLARLIADPPRDGALAVTTPAALRRAVFEARAHDIADEAANALPDEAPALSCRGAASRGQLRTLAGIGSLLLVGMASDFWISIALAASLLGILFLALANVRVAACLERAPVRPKARLPRREDSSLPVYTLVVPLYREARVAEGLCRALMGLDYPLARLDVKLVTEADDVPTRQALEAAELPGAFEILVAPPGHPRTKPRALNLALPLARGEFLVIYDAEDLPERDQRRLAVETFSLLPERVCCLQARLNIDNSADGFLPKCFAIEYAALFDAVNPGLARLGLPIPLGGTSNHFRVETLRSLRGWDAWNVTEDADLGIRLARAGYQVADLPSTTFEEAPARLRIWMAQRTRWMKGFLQTAITHSRHPRETLRSLGLVNFVGAAALTLGTVLAAMLYPLFVALAVFAAIVMAARGLDFDLLAPVVIPVSDDRLALVAASIGFVTFVAGFFSMILPAILGLWRRRWFALFPWLLAMPLYYLLVSMAAWRGLYELVAAPSRWNKTEHGLALNRRQRGGR